MLEQFGRNPWGREDLLEKIKEIEQAGDEKRRILMAELVHTYDTPFDSEDLFALSRSVERHPRAANEIGVELRDAVTRSPLQLDTTG